jgi:hypothetical protein
VWVFEVAWALAVFFGLRSLAARLLAVRIGVLAGGPRRSAPTSTYFSATAAWSRRPCSGCA